MPLLLIRLPDKPELRLEARRRRRLVDASSRDRAQAMIADAIAQRVQRAGWRRVAAYASVASEVDLAPWFDRVGAAVELALPSIDAAGTLRFRRWSRTEPLVTGPFAIEQPAPTAAEIGIAELDVILMPLLGFDRSGTRLGSGAGYYDRALANGGPRASSPVLVGIAFATQGFDSLPRDPWDVPLDAVVTENGWLDLSSA